MSYADQVAKFLEKVKQIKNENPAYKQPGDGSDGTCDCIGLIIGAIRRMGLKWSGIHGSNYAARKQIVGLEKITALSQLELGDVVLKAYEKGEKGWNLPDRYWEGKSYHNGDMRDYFHAGVVTKAGSKVEITHMTSPAMKVLTVQNLSGLGKWNFHGKAKPLVSAGGGVAPVPVPAPVPIADEGALAIVTSEDGNPVKMRQYPSTSCRTWVKLPVGTKVEIVAPGESWAKISYGRRKNWYMMAKFLDVIGDKKGKY